MPLIQVALPTPLRRLFDYWPVAGQPLPQPGVRVQVPFGNRQLVGLVMGQVQQSDVASGKIKAALAYLDQQPLFDTSHLALLNWVADYYHQPIGEVIQAALPALLRQGQALHPPQEPRWQLTEEGRQAQATELVRAPRQAALLRHLQAAGQPLTQKKLQTEGFTPAMLQGLKSRGWIEPLQLGHKPRGIGLPDLPVVDHKPKSVLAEVPLRLTAEQQQVLEQLLAHQKGFHPSLLQGVTGSGKTEVYLQLIQRVLEQGQQALVLIPEIGLTPQTLSRFQHRFNRRVVALHSGMTDRERLEAWRAAAEGKASVVLGTRSAIFVPLPRLGVILVDEEHDASFKQQDGVRYQARDLAVLRAKRQQVPVILGSATPSLESLAHARKGDYQWLHLRSRPGADVKLPIPRLLDIRNRRLNGGFSEPLLQAMQRHLDAGHQVLVLLNRRGFAPVLMCPSCGWIAGCLQCDARMTWHREPARLHCHHCDARQPIPQQCPKCEHPELVPLGAGTERAEETLQARFPQMPVIRLDRDSVRNRNDLDLKLDQIARQTPAILLGTQMLAKGHHFPAVTLATVLDADHGLYSSDPRAMERTAQLLIQVAGRAGRAENSGEVIIQTHHSDDPRLERLCVEGYEALALELLEERRRSQWPPYGHLALLRAEAHRREAVETLMLCLAEQARHLKAEDADPLTLLGPVPAPMERRQGRYHMQLLLHSVKRAPIHRMLARLLPWLEGLPEARQVRWSVDVDPDDLF
ncbi:primosomal protein N' [Marinospirillum alkaliphilum]|uniref:Replication restart protein PriA n=1 Tax=Marinospirillum alkaliphilum DSM 21637 TaxID=1122209 RepID=A0A1K1W6X5_9GAMM|nr:primosomal protein N' [Marinospirillum alkaliphilum]SFX32565.1 replication restart DNA helicase PriA [Marinospirillum alkaliphilum DSM 21637]